MLTIRGEITENAQRAELLAGRPAQLERTYTTEDTELIRRALALGGAIDAAGNVTLPAGGGGASNVVGQKTVGCLAWPYAPVSAGDAIALWENAVALDRAEGAAIAAELEEKRVAALAELAERFEAWLALPEPTPLQPGPGLPSGSHWYAYGKEVCRGDLPEELQSRVAARETQYTAALAEIARRREADAAENVAAALRRAHERLELLAQLCSDWGNESVKERIAERVLPDGNPLGLLPESEAISVVTDRLLPLDPDNGLGPYVKITKKEVRQFCVGREYDEPHDDFAFLADDADDPGVGGVTAAEWAQIQSVTAAVTRAAGCALELCPSAEVSVTPRVHRGQCRERGCPNWPVRRIGVLARITLDDVLTIEREYGAPVE